MTEHANSYRPRKRYSTLSGLIFTTTFKLLLLSLLAWLLLLIIFSGMIFYKGAYVSGEAVQRLFNSDSVWLADKNISMSHTLMSMLSQIEVRVKSSLSHVFEFISPVSDKINLNAFVNLQGVMAVIMIMIETIKIIAIRLYIFILSFPLWFSVLFIMIVDGLAQRDIRKFQAARESTFLFHRLKLLTENLFYSFFLIYMSMPIAIHPEAFLLPMVIVVSVLFMLSIKYYKKYV